MEFHKIISGAIFVGLLYLIWRHKNRKSLYLQKNGLHTPAIVLDVIRLNYWRQTSLDVRKIWCYEVSLKMTTTNNVTKEFKIKQYFEDADVPNVGEKIILLIDPRMPEHEQNMMIQDDGFRPTNTFTIFGIDIPYRKSSYKIKN